MKLNSPRILQLNKVKIYVCYRVPITCSCYSNNMTHVEEGRDVSDLVTPPQQQIVRDTPAGTSTGSNGIPLYHYQDLPPFLQGNPYITSGYRAYLPTEMCIQRCDQWHNVLFYY